jgi:hypothetical protein
MTAACYITFLVQTTDNPIVAEVHLQALSACLRVMVSEAVHQGATMALATAQLQFSVEVKVLVV